MRSVMIATWTSGDPVSFSWVRYFSMSSAFFSPKNHDSLEPFRLTPGREVGARRLALNWAGRDYGGRSIRRAALGSNRRDSSRRFGRRQRSRL